MSWINQILGGIHPVLANLHGLPLAMFLISLLLTLLFAAGYAVQGRKIWRQLRTTTAALNELRRSSVPVQPETVGKLFAWEPAKHLWDEYADTLHELRHASSGDMVLTEVRATVPAETLFTRDVLVDSRLFDDFTKHLPGILTGLGIIGTFSGLLDGLKTFDPTSSTSAVAGLKPLMEGVQHAFVASGFAIGCAMLVVFFSRLTLAYFYQLVEQLNHGIDSLYATGAGEEYLARLVKASEQSEANTAQLKDAFIEDLTKLMTNLTERQILAHEAASRALGERIGETISTAIAEPMKRVSEAIEVTTRGNGEQVSTMLETLLTGFIQKLEDTFGGQVRGINEQMQRSMDVMTTVQEALRNLLSDVKTTNEQAANHMSGKLEEAMSRAAENQQLMTEQMRQFVEEFRQLVTEEQNKSKQVMDEAVMKVLAQVASSMQELEEARKRAADQESTRHDHLTQETGKLVGGLTTQVDGLLSAVTEQVSKTQQNIDAFSNVSLRAIEGMNHGASTMNSAANRFETAGGSVSDVLERSGELSGRLMTSASTLQAAADAVRRGFEQYDSTRQTVDSHVSSLTALIESARKEAAISKELVASIQTAVDALRRSEAESREHLESVNEALLKAFTDFGNNLVSQVRKTVAETDQHLSKGTGHLSAVVEEIAKAAHRMRTAGVA